MKFCFASVFSMLSKVKKRNEVDLYSFLTEPWSTNFTVGSSEVSKRKKGEDPIPKETCKNFIDRDSDELCSLYKKDIDKYLDKKMYNEIVLSIKKILSNDESISDDEEIGSCAYTKGKILDSNTFDFYDLLVNVMKYILNKSNVGYSTCDVTIPKDFVESQIPLRNTVFLETSPSLINVSLKLSINKTNFDKIFTEISLTNSSLHLYNPSLLKLYRLDIRNKEMIYEDLKKFIYKNTGRYVFSRSQLNTFMENDECEMIVKEAIDELVKRGNLENSKLAFADIMLYSFLECSLKAPKIMSSFELNLKPGTRDHKSRGIFLLPKGTIGPTNQIVFGTSEVKESLKEAIDSVIYQAKIIKGNLHDERKLIDQNILSWIMPLDNVKYLKSVIIPSANETKVEDSFGIFISYKADKIENNELSNDKYLTEIEKKMNDDILNVYSYIQEKIKENDLCNYSFYLFFLPLFNIEQKVPEIIQGMNGGVK